MFPHVLVGPLKILAALHSIPLVGRVRLGHEIRDAGCHLGVAPTDLFADSRYGFGHLDNTFKVHGPFAGQTTKKVELDGLIVILEGHPATLE